MPINRRLPVILGTAQTGVAMRMGGRRRTVVRHHRLRRGGVFWQCNYRSFEECYPNVLAGNKGSCNVNPAGPGPYAVKTAAMHQHRKPHRPRRRLHRSAGRH
jgi:hypothetical protein